MEIKRVGSQPSAKGPSEWFTGTVRIDPLFTAPDPALVAGAKRNLRAMCSNGLAHASARSDPHRYFRLRPGTARGRPHRGGSSWRCGLVRAKREALARSRSQHSHDSHCYSGKERRESCRVDGTRFRRAIPKELIRCPSPSTAVCIALVTLQKRESHASNSFVWPTRYSL